ncbi:MAG: hypothetical protein DWI21_08415 [Planctomycetota bacterium]|nr:MAG: hypothetical protein DWI21_08415 [Planctomycetota bacterium]
MENCKFEEPQSRRVSDEPSSAVAVPFAICNVPFAICNPCPKRIEGRCRPSFNPRQIKTTNN